MKLINLKTFIIGAIILLLAFGIYKQFKDVNLVKSGEKAGTQVGHEVNKNMNNN